METLVLLKFISTVKTIVTISLLLEFLFLFLYILQGNKDLTKY